MLQNYHLHSTFSGDGQSSMELVCRAAWDKGIQYIAITDHHDLGLKNFWIADPDAYIAEVERCRTLFPQMDIARGLELDYRAATWQITKDAPQRFQLDFALLSLHFIDGVDPFQPEYFDGRSRQAANSFYLTNLADSIEAVEGPFVLSHITYVSKFAPFDDPTLLYADYPDELDRILKLAIDKGFGVELNSSGIKNNAGVLPGADTLRRYRELGGEIITLGSDAHNAAWVDYGLEQTLEAARAAGFRYIAIYKSLKHTFIKIE
jgi:histidinol-phosphatase (PHP family)